MKSADYHLVVVGAGGFGREVLATIQEDPASVRLPAGSWSLKGCLDSNPDALKNYEARLPILGDPRHYGVTSKDIFICAIGDPATKLSICRNLQAKGAQFIQLVSSMSHIGIRCNLGVGCVLMAGARLSVDITLGDFVCLNGYATIGHDATLSDGCTLSAHCDVTGGAKLGEGVFLGSHATITPGVSLGDYARVGAGSAVVRNVPPYTTVMGVPAKTIFSHQPQEKT
jgi:sugar O-acyltransferase (sialic acid O-acetyltransferase NeuD family)